MVDSDRVAGRLGVEAMLAAVRDALGDEAVFSDRGTLGEYRDPFSVLEDDPYVAGAVVRPGSVDEVRAVMRLANEHRCPLWPISRGKNLAYGGAAPRVAGTVVLDLGRMNRIIEVNEKFGYALVEPGVSYFDLHRHLVETGSDLWLDVPDLGWGSVVGNTVERGNGYTPYGDHFMIQCGMEVVLANGDLVRTGMGAMANSNAWQLSKFSYGPYHDGLFTQSNFGVVTKVGIWLMPRPPGYRPFMICFERDEDLHAVVERVRPLRINQVIQNVASIRSLLLEAAPMSARSRYLAAGEPVTREVERQIMADHDIGMWNLYGAQYGPQAVMDAYWGEIREAFDTIPGARFYFAQDRPGDSLLATRAERMGGVPGLADLKLLDWFPHGGHINFSPISPASGEDATRQVEMVRGRCGEYGQDYMGDIIVGVRELHHIVMLVFDTKDEKQKRLTYELCRTLVDDAAAAGYGEYRTHLCLMDQIAATYNFNDGAVMRLNEALKDALDPNGIIAPGKQGIWPSHLRDHKFDQL
jgi:4-cresol dehydrogenase (hydroxylating)